MADALACHPTASPSPLALAVSPTEAEKAKLISVSVVARTQFWPVKQRKWQFVESFRKTLCFDAAGTAPPS